MTTVYVGQIELFAFNFAPRNWALCNGQLMSIQQNQALFALLGTYYGGNGTTNFALPNLQSRIPLGYGKAPGSGITYNLGEFAGEENHLLLTTEMPQHNHFLMTDATTAATSNSGTPASTVVLGKTAGVEISGTTSTPFTVSLYGTGNPGGIMAPPSIGLTGGSVAHENRMPYLVLNFCIALFGVFPSRN